MTKEQLIHKRKQMVMDFIIVVVRAAFRIGILMWLSGLTIGVTFLAWLVTKEIVPIILFFVSAFVITPYVIHREFDMLLERVLRALNDMLDKASAND